MSVADPETHHFGKSDPDPHQSEKPHLDLHTSKKADPDPYQSDVD
jgi:hypothetical protein